MQSSAKPSPCFVKTSPIPIRPLPHKKANSREPKQLSSKPKPIWSRLKKLTQDAPKVVEEKLKVSKQTEAKLGETTAVLDTFKVQVTAQQAKADTLFKNYLESLPK